MYIYFIIKTFFLYINMDNVDTYQISNYFNALKPICPTALNTYLNNLAKGELVSTGKNATWHHVAGTNYVALVHTDEKHKKIITQLDKCEQDRMDDIGQHEIISYGGRSRKKTQKTTTKKPHREASDNEYNSSDNGYGGKVTTHKPSTKKTTKILSDDEQSDDTYYKKNSKMDKKHSSKKANTSTNPGTKKSMSEDGEYEEYNSDNTSKKPRKKSTSMDKKDGRKKMAR